MKSAEIKPENKMLDGKRIGIFGKGGSGKSTVVIMLARALQKSGYEVCVLDADSTNVGLSTALGLASTPEPLISYYGGMVFSGGRVTCPVDDPSPLPESEVDLDTLPAQFQQSDHAGINLLVAGKIRQQGPGAGCDGPVAKIARDIRVRKHGAPLLTLLDFKAGLEDTARGVITSLDWAIVIVDPTAAAMDMAANMKELVDRIKNGQLPATQHLEDPELVTIANRLYQEARIKGVKFLLNKVGDQETENYLRTQLSNQGILPDGAIYWDPSISTSWMRGASLETLAMQDGTQSLIAALETAERASLSADIAHPQRS